MRVHPCRIANTLWRLAAAAGSKGWARHAQSLLRSRHSGRGGAASHSWRHGRISPAGRLGRRPVPHTPLLFVPKRQRRLGTATLETPRTVREIRKASAHRARAGHCEIAPFRPPFSGVFFSISRVAHKPQDLISSACCENHNADHTTEMVVSAENSGRSTPAALEAVRGSCPCPAASSLLAAACQLK